MTPEVKPPGSQLPVFWETDVIYFANLLSVFYGNSCETESLTHQIDAIDTYAGRLAIILELFRAMHARFPGRSLGLIITADEETGGDAGVRHLFDDVGIRCGVCLVPDGGSPNQIIVQEKGALHCHLRTTGRARYAARPWLADNPLERLMDRLTELRQHFGAMATVADHWHPTFSVTIARTSNRTTN